MKCIVVDDEPIALEGISEYVNRTPFLELTGQCKNGFEAIEHISKGLVDLVFLDINMPDLTGIEMVNSIPQPPMIIFTTAYPDYALKGFELNAVDYILKPISYEKFLLASQKAYKQYSLHQAQNEPNESDSIYVKVDKKLLKIEVSDIIYAEGLKDYIRIHTSKSKHIAYLSLNKLMDSLSMKEFIQVHKSFIISISAISAIEGNFIQIGDDFIPIGRTYRSELFERVVDKKYLKK